MKLEETNNTKRPAPKRTDKIPDVNDIISAPDIVAASITGLRLIQKTQDAILRDVYNNGVAGISVMVA